MSNFPELSNDRYVLCDHVIYPLALQHERNTSKDNGTKRDCHSTFASSSSTFDHPSSSHHVDDDTDENNEVSNKEDTAYLCLHFTKDHKGTRINMPYPEKSIRRIQDIVIKYSGRYQTWSLHQETIDTPY
nr:hypothetical protein [Tanacetum cinerariifolium]